MKNLARLLFLSALLGTASYAAPFLTVGDGAEIFLTGAASARVDSNIFLSSTARSDTVLEAVPGLQLVFGKNSAVQGSWAAMETISDYTDHRDLNSNLFSTNFGANYSDGKSNASVNGSYAQSNQNQVDDGTHLDFLIRRNTTGLGATGEVAVTEKTSVAAGVQYGKTDYFRAGFSNSEVLTVPVDYYYEVTPKVDLSLGYRYRGTWEKIGEDTVDHFFSLGARGEFTPKLSGQFSVGLTQRRFTHLSGKSLVGVDSSLSYAVSPKTSVQFGVSNDFDTNSQGQQQKNFAVRASALTNLSEQWSVTTGLSYRAISYYTAVPSRVDNYIEAQVGATYTASKSVSFTGAYAYRTNQSDLPSSNFNDNVLTVTGNFRY